MPASLRTRRSTRTPRARLAMLALALALAPCLSPPTAAAAPIACGMVVQDRVVLDRDLRCAGPALILRNPRTVVQLNGHVIEAARSCRDGEPTVGIAVEASADRATILGPGVVRGFSTGIAVGFATQVQLRDLRISDNCGTGIALHHTNGARLRDLVLDRNGDGGEQAAAIRVEHAARCLLVDSTVFLNDAAQSAAAVDLRSCEACRVAGNRIVANHGPGLHLDVESKGNEVERNLVLGQREHDVVDEGSDNLFTLNAFERGDGVDPAPLWPLLGMPASPAPGIAGCGTLHDRIGPRSTVTLTCPQDAGLRAVRNSVVSYRLLNIFNPVLPYAGTCAPGTVQPASGASGGAVTCTNPDSLYPVVVEVTCCLN